MHEEVAQDVYSFFGESTRPESIDQRTPPVFRFCRFINTLARPEWNHSFFNDACFVMADGGQTAEKGSKILRVARTESDHAKVAHALFREGLIPLVFVLGIVS